MIGKRVKQLDAITTRLEGCCANLARHDGRTVEQDVSPAVADDIVRAVDECLALIFGPVDAALIAGEPDRARLLRVATAPLIRALGAAPSAQQTSAARTALWTMVSLLVTRLAQLRESAGSAPLAS